MQRLIDVQNSTIALLNKELEDARANRMNDVPTHEIYAELDARIAGLAKSLGRAINDSLDLRLPAKIANVRGEAVQAQQRVATLV